MLKSAGQVVQSASNLHDSRILKLQLCEHCKVVVVQDVLYCSVELTASAQVLALRVSDLRALQQRNLEKSKDYTFWQFFFVALFSWEAK